MNNKHFVFQYTLDDSKEGRRRGGKEKAARPQRRSETVALSDKKERTATYTRRGERSPAIPTFLPLMASSPPSSQKRNIRPTTKEGRPPAKGKPPTRNVPTVWDRWTTNRWSKVANSVEQALLVHWQQAEVENEEIVVPTTGTAQISGETAEMVDQGCAPAKGTTVVLHLKHEHGGDGHGSHRNRIEPKIWIQIRAIWKSVVTLASKLRS